MRTFGSQCVHVMSAAAGVAINGVTYTERQLHNAGVSLEHYIRGFNGKSVSLAELCCSASIVAWMVIGQEWVEQVRGS